MVYVVTMIIEREYCGREIVGVFATRSLAENYIDTEGQGSFEHWSGSEIELYSIEEWEITA
jgi:hypothetical protein